MKLHINGDELDVPSGLTLAALLEHLALRGPVAIEVNRNVIPRADHARHAVHEGDEIEIVHFVGGG